MPSITEYDPAVEELLRANGVVVKRKNAEIIKYELDVNHYYYLGKIGYAPGVTSIIDEAGPIGFGLREWWKNNTKEESDFIFQTAGDMGKKLHQAYEDLLKGIELNLFEHYPTLAEKRALMALQAWFNIFKPIEYESEQVVAGVHWHTDPRDCRTWDDKEGCQCIFAGTLDFLGTAKRSDAAEALVFTSKRAKDEFIDGQPDKIDTWLIDFKTGKSLHFGHEIQVGAAYKQAVIDGFGITPDFTALLRLPSQHKRGFEFKLIDRSTSDFDSIYHTYLSLHQGKIPVPQEIKVYPPTLRLFDPIKENKK